MAICIEAFYKHWILFPTVWHLPRLSKGRTKGRPKCAKNVLKWRTFKLTAWITGKRLKIDGYMLRGIWQALNSLSIHLTFTIVPGVYPGEAKICKNWAKIANFWIFELNYWKTVEDRHLLRLSQGRTQGRPKCALDSLDIAKYHPQRQKATT